MFFEAALPRRLGSSVLGGIRRAAARYVSSGRMSLGRLGAQVSSKLAAVHEARRLEIEGSVDESLAAWEKLSGEPGYAEAKVRLLLRRAREAIEDQDWLAAVQTYEGLLRTHGKDPRVRGGLESAALRGARRAQAHEDPLSACRFWAAYGRVTSDRVKYQRNLGQAAFNAAHRAEADGDLAEARVLWAYVLLAAPDSEIAKAHLRDCLERLASAPQEESDIVRESWSVLRELMPHLSATIAGSGAAVGEERPPA
jgi:hypothetical protein